MKVLLCAATPIEYRACVAGVAKISTQHEFTVLQTGMGAEKALQALRSHLVSLKLVRYDCIISTGFAGSRSRELKIGSFLLATRVQNSQGVDYVLKYEEWANALQKAGITFQLASVCEVSEILSDDPKAIDQGEPLAVDMESFALATVASEYSVRFQVLRMISDTVDQPIPESIKVFSQNLWQGFVASMKSPKKLFRFVAQTAKLPSELKVMWERISNLKTLMFASIALPIFALSSSAFTVDEYLAQVSQSNDGYHSLVEQSLGANASGQSAELLFKPQVFTNLQYSYDPRDTHSQPLYGDHTLAKSFSAGVREQTPWGLQLQLSLDYNQETLLGISSPLITKPTVTNVYPVPVFKWSLWQNWAGRMDRANQRMEEAKSRAESYGSDFGAKALMVEAEGRYWKLAALREMIKLQQGSLERAKSVYAVDIKKARAKLIDSGDALLSESAVQGKDLELKSMQSEEKSAARAFNSSRGKESDQVEEVLALPSAKSFLNFKLPKQAGLRGDLKVAEQQSLATQAGYDLAHEKLLPDVSLYGSIFAMGLSFSMPLDLSLTSDARKGYARQSQAAELNLKHKHFEQENEWIDLKSRFMDNVARLYLAMKLEDLQRRKLEDANRRRAHAMTIAFQVFQYELDYMAAAQARLQIEGTLLGLRAQARLYADDAKDSEP